MHHGIDVTFTSRGQRVVLALHGPLDADTGAPQVERCFPSAMAGGPQELVVDLAEVDTVDASGLAALVDVCEAARRLGARVVVRDAPGELRRAAQIDELDRMFDRS